MKRFLALLLCLLLCMSMLPVAAFAESADIVSNDDDIDEDEQQLELQLEKRLAHEHEMHYVDAVQPSFKAGHIAYYKCDSCGKMFADVGGETELSYDETVLPAIHSKPTDSTKIKITPATCTRNGKIEYTCSDENCNVKGFEVISAHGVEVYHAANVATCFATGNIEYYQCSECGRIYADAAATQELENVVVPAVSHSLIKVESKSATCSAAGNTEYWKCEYCGTLFANAEGTETTTVEAVTIDPLQHSLTKTEAKGATCDTDGNIEYWTCSGCEAVFRDEAGENAVEAADVIIEKLGHDLEEVPARAACTEDGNIRYWVCVRDGCEKLFSDSEGTTEIRLEDTVIPEGHQFDGGFCKDCRTEDPNYKGPTFKDSDLTVIPGAPLVIRVDADCEKTKASGWSVAIDGVTISKNDITLTSGSSVFTITGDAIDALNLAPGSEHTVTIKIGDETITATLTVSGDSATYSVTVQGTTNGKVTVDKSMPKAEDTVTLTIKPDSGYVLDTLSVKDSNNTGITVTNNKFIMPASNVTVTATFKAEYIVKFNTVLPISTVVDKPDNQSVPPDGKVTKPKDPSDSAQHHVFKGWFKDSGYKTAFDFTKDTITENTVLYAKWSHPYEGGICRYCWEAQKDFKEVKDPAFKAKITKGSGGTAHYGSRYSFTANPYYPYADDDTFAVKVDGKTISPDKYITEKNSNGSTIVTLHRSYIKSLRVGAYDIAIVTNLGTAYGTFRVSSSPKTGDDSNVALWVTVGVISAAGVAGIAYYLLKKRKK